jgi:hypothetical protein
MFKIIGADQKEYGPISIEQIRQWIKDGRLSGQTPAQRDGGEWQQLSAYSEFADLFQVPGAAAPSSAPSAPYASAPAPGVAAPMGGGSREAALSAVKIPAIILIVIASIGIALFLLAAVGNFAGMNRLQGAQAQNLPPETRAQVERFQGPVGGIIDLVVAAMNGVVLFGGLKMMRLESRGLAMTACILAMIPPNCCCILGIPFGIWGLVVLNKPEVKSQFTS